MTDIGTTEHVADALPPPSAELVLLRVFVSAYLETSSRKKGEAFMMACARMLGDEETLAAIIPFRPEAQHRVRDKARREAMAMFRVMLPALLAKLPPM